VAGYPLIEIKKGDVTNGVGWLPLSIRGTRRQSSSVAYLHPLNAVPKNLAIVLDAPVERIVIDDDGCAKGVSVGGATITVREEVVVCCGAFESPKLLMLSGVGPSGHLRSHGIGVAHDLPAVGENLMDHPEAVVIFEATRRIPETGGHHWDAALFAGEHSSTPPEIMIHHGTEAFQPQGPTSAPGPLVSDSGFCLSPNVARPRSRGVVNLRSRDSAAPPIIDPRYFTDSAGHDEATLLKGVAIARELASTEPLGAWAAREIWPGAELRDDTQLSERVRHQSGTVFHPAGTVRMGATGDVNAAVDPELRVQGLTGLRVADASVFPTMIGVNIAITCMMVAERCADLIRSGRA
jgi:choline dehydrogenase-like flavoprotein